MSSSPTISPIDWLRQHRLTILARQAAMRERLSRSASSLDEPLGEADDPASLPLISTLRSPERETDDARRLADAAADRDAERYRSVIPVRRNRRAGGDYGRSILARVAASYRRSDGGG